MTSKKQTNSDAVLGDFAKRINEHVEAKRACEAKTVMHAVRVGQLLIEAKAIAPHGKFMPWVKANIAVSQREAQRYMMIASDEYFVEAVEREYDTVSHLTIRKAVALAGRAKRMQKAFDQLKAKLSAAGETRRDFAKALSECRAQHFDGKAADFTAFLIKQCGIGRTTAERAPALLDQDYSDEAWLQVMLDDIGAKLPQFKGLTADLFVGGGE